MDNTLEKIKASTGIGQSFYGSDGDKSLFGLNFTSPSYTFVDGRTQTHSSEDRHTNQVRTLAMSALIGSIAYLSTTELTSMAQLVSSVS